MGSGSPEALRRVLRRMTLSAGPIPRAPVRSFIVIAILKDPLQRPVL